MTTISRFAQGLKAHLVRHQSFVEYLPYTGGDTRGEGSAGVDWEALSAEIDAFCDEFKAKQKPMGG